MINFPDYTLRRSHDLWRERLAEVRRHYDENRNPETHTEFLRVLRIFSDLVVRGKDPLSY